MPRRNKVDDLDFEIHVDPSCLSDPMEEHEQAQHEHEGHEDPVAIEEEVMEEQKAEVGAEPNSEADAMETHEANDVEEVDISTEEHAPVESEAEASETHKDNTVDETTIDNDHEEEQAELEVSAIETHEDESTEEAHTHDDDKEDHIILEQDTAQHDDLDAASDAASVDEAIPEMHSDAEHEYSEHEDLPKPTQTESSWEDVDSEEDEGQDTPLEDETITVEDLASTEEHDGGRDSLEHEAEDEADYSHHEESASDASGSRRESAISSSSYDSHRRHSSRTEALIHKAAQDIIAKIGQESPRESLQSAIGSEGGSYLSRSRPASIRQSESRQSVSRHSISEESHFSTEDEEQRSTGGNSSHHENEDDVFSDHSPRSSMGSMSETEQKKVEEAMAQMARSPRVSGISGISQYQDEEEEFVPTIRGAPRPAFRSPSSVKALQMSSPPASVLGSPRTSRRFPTVSRLGSPSFNVQHSPKKTPPRFKRNTPPLVLLHVTLLPLRWGWGDVLDHATSDDLSQEAKNLREAWRTLQDRMGDTTVERGILLPHPQNDYEILEERLLEALELPMRRRARILECGHYLGPSNEMTIEESDSDEDYYDDSERRGSRLSKAMQTHWCKTCRSEIHYESLGPGKIFRVKVYASNGLMKAGAWEACWKEMERVDVEIEPIVEVAVEEELARLEAEQLRELEALEEQERLLEEERRAFEEEKMALERQRAEEEERLEEEKRLRAEEEERRRIEAEGERLRMEEEENRRAEHERRRSEEEEKLRAEEEALQAEEDKARAEEEALRAEEEELRVAEEKARAEEEERLRAEKEDLNREASHQNEPSHQDEAHNEDPVAESSHEDDKSRAFEEHHNEPQSSFNEGEGAQPSTSPRGLSSSPMPGTFTSTPAFDKRQSRDEERLRDMYGESSATQQPRQSYSQREEYTQQSEYQQPRSSDYMQRETPPSPSVEAFARREERRQALKTDSLPELLLESFRVLMQDKKNVIIGLLSVLIVLFALRGNPPERDHRVFQTVINRQEVPTVTVTQAAAELETVQTYSATTEAWSATTQAAVNGVPEIESFAMAQEVPRLEIESYASSSVNEAAMIEGALSNEPVMGSSMVVDTPRESVNTQASSEVKSVSSSSTQTAVRESTSSNTQTTTSTAAESEETADPCASNSEARRETETVISERIVRIVETVTEVETATVKITATETQIVHAEPTSSVEKIELVEGTSEAMPPLVMASSEAEL